MRWRISIFQIIIFSSFSEIIQVQNCSLSKLCSYVFTITFIVLIDSVPPMQVSSKCPDEVPGMYEFAVPKLEYTLSPGKVRKFYNLQFLSWVIKTKACLQVSSMSLLITNQSTSSHTTQFIDWNAFFSLKFSGKFQNLLAFIIEGLCFSRLPSH